MGLDLCYCSNTPNSRGVAILFNNNYEHTTHKIETDSTGIFIFIDLTILDSVRFTLVKMYGPNDDNPKFYKKITLLIEDFQNENCLRCGNWN